MKQYFAKYLPIEGEIEVGDYINILEGRIHKLSQNEVPFPFSKKHKLFLCSRDIQVGDKNIQFIHSHGEIEVIEEVISQQQLTFIKNLSTIPGNKAFKVIGEISPDATWVKEGDEFDEKQVMWQARDNDGQIECYEDWGIRKVLRDNYGYYVVAIKCSNCKTFH